MKKHIDKDRQQVERDALNRLSDLLEIGDEDLFVAAVKDWKPNISSDELVRLINAFRAALAEKRGLRR